MDWMNWKTWTTIAVIILTAFAIYTFAAPDQRHTQDNVPVAVASEDAKRAGTAAVAGNLGFDQVHKEWMEPQAGAYKSERDLFSYKEPPPPPPPPPPAAPPDRDKDNVPDFRDNCPDKYNPDQADLDHNGVGDICQPNFVPPPPPPPPKPVPPNFDYKYIGTFGSAKNPLATFARNDEIVNVRTGDTIDGKFILRSIGLESVEIGFVGFPADERLRVPIGSQSQ